MKCKNCNEALDATWKVCPACTQPVEEIKTCTDCKKELKDHWKICPFCQTSVANQTDMHKSDQQGDWEGDQEQGKDTRHYENGDVYHGELKNGNRQGKGKMQYANGAKYEGEWTNDCRHGMGAYTDAEGNFYEGEWEDDLRSGHGIIRYANGDIYDGEWRYDQRSDWGIINYANGEIYEGEWEEDYKHGKGIMNYANGDVYDGEWSGGKKHGQGKMIYKNGDTYQGDWENDHKQGEGEMEYANGGVYKGAWGVDSREGHGIMEYPSGDIYEGEWEFDRRFYYGTMKYANGDVYEGEWLDDQINGDGKYTFADGRTYEGYWENGELEGKDILNVRVPKGDEPSFDTIDEAIDYIEDEIQQRNYTELFPNTKKHDFKTAKIGKQIWMAENLNVDTFRNGDPIPRAETDEEWEAAGEEGKPAWCYYKNDPENGKKYGRLYNWYAVNDSRGLAPEGWKIPSDEEWTILTDHLGSKGGSKLKSTSGWDHDGNGRDNSGFSALPGGHRWSNGSCEDVGGYGYWWSATEFSGAEAWYRSMLSGYGGVYRGYSIKTEGFSIRCFRDID